MKKKSGRQGPRRDIERRPPGSQRERLLKPIEWFFQAKPLLKKYASNDPSNWIIYPQDINEKCLKPASEII